MMTSLRRRGGPENHRKKMNDFVMIEKIVLIGLIKGRMEGMEGVREMVAGIMIEKEGRMLIGMSGRMMNIGIGEKIAMGVIVVMGGDRERIIVINIVEIGVETDLTMKIIEMEETKVKFNKSVIFKILVHIIGVIVCQILVTMDKKIVLVIVQYQLNKRKLDIV